MPMATWLPCGRAQTSVSSLTSEPVFHLTVLCTVWAPRILDCSSYRQCSTLRAGSHLASEAVRECLPASASPPPLLYFWPPLQSPIPSNSWKIHLSSPQGSTQGSVFSLEFQNTCFSQHVVNLPMTKYHTVFWTIQQSFCLYLSRGYFHADLLDKSTTPHLPCFIPLFSLVAEEWLLALQGKSAISPARHNGAAARGSPEVLVLGASVLELSEVRRHNSLQGS